MRPGLEGLANSGSRHCGVSNLLQWEIPEFTKLIRQGYIIFICLLALAACKEEPTDPAEPTSEELISRTWQVQSVQVNGQAEDAADYSNFRFTFNANQTYRFLNPDEQQGSWQLTGNGTLLILNRGTEQEQQVPIFELSETELLLEFTEESEKLGTTRTRFALAL